MARIFASLRPRGSGFLIKLLIGALTCLVLYTIVGFFVMLAIVGWNPDPPHRKRVELPSTHMTQMTLRGIA